MSIAPKKSLGQHFLANPRILEKIATAAELEQDDIVVEVGPGKGTLTSVLEKRVGHVIAIEKDHRLVPLLKQQYSTKSNVTILEGDILTFDPVASRLLAGRYKIVANLPYYITSHFLRVALEQWPRPKLMVLMVQKEVAQRLIAKPPHMNLLALSVQFYADVKVVGSISRGNFRPQPDVDSAIVRLVPHRKTMLQSEEKDGFFRAVKTAFAGKRKLLTNTLSREFKISKEKLGDALKGLSLKPTARPQELALEQWILLSKRLPAT